MNDSLKIKRDGHNDHKREKTQNHTVSSPHQKPAVTLQTNQLQISPWNLSSFLRPDSLNLLSAILSFLPETFHSWHYLPNKHMLVFPSKPLPTPSSKSREGALLCFNFYASPNHPSGSASPVKSSNCSISSPSSQSPDNTGVGQTHSCLACMHSCLVSGL